MSEPVCPCELVAHPRIPWNPPGRSRISYRDGDFASFRHALLLAPPGEGQLAQWRPSARQDLALQMVEWWAYLADVLTFYNERIANQAYLRTADLPDSLDRLVRLLGYRPRPGIGATGTVAALLAAPPRARWSGRRSSPSRRSRTRPAHATPAWCSPPTSPSTTRLRPPTTR